MPLEFVFLLFILVISLPHLRQFGRPLLSLPSSPPSPETFWGSPCLRSPEKRARIRQVLGLPFSHGSFHHQREKQKANRLFASKRHSHCVVSVGKAMEKSFIQLNHSIKQFLWYDKSNWSFDGAEIWWHQCLKGLARVEPISDPVSGDSPYIVSGLRRRKKAEKWQAYLLTTTCYLHNKQKTF